MVRGRTGTCRRRGVEVQPFTERLERGLELDVRVGCLVPREKEVRGRRRTRV